MHLLRHLQNFNVQERGKEGQNCAMVYRDLATDKTTTKWLFGIVY